MRESDGWWVYRRPFGRGPLFVVAVVIGLVAFGGVLANSDEYGSLAFVISLLSAWPMAFLGVGVVGGTAREFLGSRR